jgi:hypothetical protein
VLLTLSALRYVQRWENLKLINPPSVISSPFESTEFINANNYYDLKDVVLEDAGPVWIEHLASLGHDRQFMTLLRTNAAEMTEEDDYYGAVSRTTHLEFFLDDDPFLRAHVDPTSEEFLASQECEGASEFSQYQPADRFASRTRRTADELIQSLKAEGPDADQRLLESTIRIRDLLAATFPYADASAVGKIVRVVRGSREEDDIVDPGSLNAAAGAALGAFAEYANTIVRGYPLLQMDRKSLWEQLAPGMSNTRISDEARFNVIDSVIRASLDKPDDLDFERARMLDVADDAQRFVQQFPQSRLADDALRYAMQAKTSVGDFDAAFAIWSRLVTQYEGSDSVARVRAWAVDWLKSNPLGRGIADQGADTIVQAPRATGVTSFGELAQSVSNDPVGVVVLLSRTLEPDSRTDLSGRPAREVGRRALIALLLRGRN